jgi:GTPase involved in cell partitioning and DNA repair
MSGMDNRSPADDDSVLLEELKYDDLNLLSKMRTVIANKMDGQSAQENLKNLKQIYKIHSIKISCVTQNGINYLKTILFQTKNGKILSKIFLSCKILYGHLLSVIVIMLSNHLECEFTKASIVS